MSKTIWHITMSVDGYIAGADHAMDWVAEYGAASSIADDVMHSTGAILAGRRWYDLAIERWDGTRGIYRGAWSGPVFVNTRRPAPEDSSVTFLSGGIEDAVKTALAAAGGKDVVVFGANTAERVLQAGLLDEIVIHLAPVLLGDGIRLYGRPGLSQVPLERVAVAESGQVTDLRFRVQRP